MKYIEATENFIVFCCGKGILVYQNGNSEGRLIDLPSTGTTPGSEVGALNIKLSPDEKYLAVACESKVVTVWCTQTWTLQFTHSLVKRPVSIDITSDSMTLLVADKTGDVYHFPLKEDSSVKEMSECADSNGTEEKITDSKVESEVLLGHLSMLLDVAVTKDQKYVITCDRDEKIRISHYPNAYNIESFCLGHTEFVMQIDILPGEEPLLLSCSGDGTLKLWNYLSGHCLSSADTHEHTTQYLHHFEAFCQQKVKDSEEAKRFLPDRPAVKNFSVYTSKDGDCYVAVIVDRVPALLLYKIEERKLHYVSTTETKENFPLVVNWLKSGELIVEQSSLDQPLGVYQLQQNLLTSLNNHPLISFSLKHKEEFNRGKKELSIDILYKQRYDNVADYLKKKQERLDTEKAAEAGIVRPVKKGRWV
ncbi:tRNA (guanine-N(7)-)-methyltransferase non-catalytic subunit wdr4 [Palaemon carinicauda]|uniref:tRNA (guanine-N(7)-)-methyltransferase non-catalytic subunit wdr4 n=1 Tax=Palaemon carinicauda TaxID=392227 RepID=UPI0035B5A5A7